MMWKLGRLMHLQRDRDAENRTERRLSSGPRRAVCTADSGRYQLSCTEVFEEVQKLIEYGDMEV